MPGPGIAQPDFLPALKFRLDNIEVLETGGFGPSSIVTAPNPFTLRMDLGFDGPLTLLLFGLVLTAEHHAQHIESGAVFALPVAGGIVVIPPALAPASHLTISSGPYATVVGVAAPGVPLGTGTYRITTHIHPPPPIAGIVSAFYDGLIVQVVS